MNNLVIGNSSQLAYYFPDNYIKVSSRNLDLSKFENMIFDRVFITFAEQRLYIMDDLKLFTDTNVDYTLKLIKFFLDKAKYVVAYGTCELWNNIDGPIDLNNPMNYTFSPYCRSKHMMTDEIHNINKHQTIDKAKIIVIHPFNFNSPYRKPGFLFSKIYDSLINKTKITIGDTYFYRDITHPSHIIERSLIATQDELVGSGRLIFVNDFIRDLYSAMDLDYDKYVTEDFKENTKSIRKIFYLKSNTAQYTYDKLLIDTITNIKIIQ